MSLMSSDGVNDRGASARRTLIETAERMYAERGINGVSLRQIGAAAGQLNTGAARYHFGSKVGLINAVFEHRMGPINAMRIEMLDAVEADGEGGSMRRLIEAFLLPLATALGDRRRPSWYIRFAVAAGAVGGAAPTQLAGQEWTRGMDRLRRLVFDALSSDSVPHRELRWQLCLSYVAHALADREALVQQPPRGHFLPHDVFLSTLTDTAVALISAPASPATRHVTEGARS